MANDITLKDKNGGIKYPKTVTAIVYENGTGKTLQTIIDEMRQVDAATNTRTQHFKADVNNLDTLKNKTDIGLYNYVGTGWRGSVSVCYDSADNVSQVALSSSTPSYNGNTLTWLSAQPCAMARTYTNGAWSHWEKVGAPVVNDLTTGGTDKALSAEMGKTLKEGLDALCPKIDEIYPSFSGTVDLSVIDEVTLFPNGTNWLVNNNYKCKFVKCIPYATYNITANPNNNSHITFVKSIGTSGQSVNYATGYSNVVTIGTGQTKTFVVPADAVYMCVAVLETSDRTPSSIIQKSLQQNIYENNNAIVALQNDTNSIQSGKANLVKELGKNLFDKTKIITGKYIVYSTGELSSDADSNVSDLIPVEAGEIYHIHRPNIVGTGAVRFLDSNGSVLVPLKVDGTAWSNFEPTNGDTGNTYSDCKVKAPETAVSIQFTTQFNSNGNLDATQIEKGSDFTGYESFAEKSVLSSSEIPSELAKKWAGKKWVVVGDSLTEVNNKTTKNYHAYISEKTGINVVNMGVSGSGYHSLYDTNRAFFQRVASIPVDADVITIFGSGNDLTFAATNMGSPEDTSTDTICGCVNTTLNTILSVYMANGKCPVIGVVTPTPWNSNNTPNNPECTMAVYSNAIIECCKRKSIPVLDLFHQSNLHPDSETFRTLAYSHDNGGGVHPDETGHKIIASMFEAFIGSLLLS